MREGLLTQCMPDCLKALSNHLKQVYTFRDEAPGLQAALPGFGYLGLLGRSHPSFPELESIVNLQWTWLSMNNYLPFVPEIGLENSSPEAECEFRLQGSLAVCP